MLDIRESANDSTCQDSANFIVIDYGHWSGGIVAGLFRTIEGNILIRISEAYRHDLVTSNIISTELVARFHWHIEQNPLARLWPVNILMDRVPEHNTEVQHKGMQKLTSVAASRH